MVVVICIRNYNNIRRHAAGAICAVYNNDHRSPAGYLDECHSRGISGRIMLAAYVPPRYT